MKQIITLLIGALLLTGCGVGSYSIASGKPNESSISFTYAEKAPITVTIDGQSYPLETVKTKAWRTERNIKKTAQNTLFIANGQHEIVVTMNGQTIYSQKVLLGNQEHRVIEL
ncbi:MAG: hypothetical protein K6E35_03005 [Bacteroidales bacterium]|nr:hypothetical protein [Bacteroidales bacterium]